MYIVYVSGANNPQLSVITIHFLLREMRDERRMGKGCCVRCLVTILFTPIDTALSSNNVSWRMALASRMAMRPSIKLFFAYLSASCQRKCSLAMRDVLSNNFVLLLYSFERCTSRVRILCIVCDGYGIVWHNKSYNYILLRAAFYAWRFSIYCSS